MSCNTAQLLGVISVDVNRINSSTIQRLNERNKSDNESQRVQLVGSLQEILILVLVQQDNLKVRYHSIGILRDAVEKELLKQIAQGILERVVDQLHRLQI